jgi:capsular exopolysaccharide synthesis family protein
VLRVIAAPADVAVGQYLLRRDGGGGYTVSVEKAKRPVPLPARVEIGRPFRLGTVVLALAPALRDEPPAEVRFQIVPLRRAAAGLRQEMLVARQEGGSKLLEVSYRSTDPALAAAVVNGVAGRFIEYKEGNSRSEARTTVQVLRDQVADYQRELRAAEDRLEAYQSSQRIVHPMAEAEQQVRRLAQLQAGRDAAQVERSSLGRLLNDVRRQPTRVDEPSPYRQLATFPSFISNLAVQDILEHLTRLEGERSAALVRRTPEDPDVQQLTTRIRELELQLYQMANSYLAGLDNQIASSTGVLDQFGGEMARVPAREIEYARLLRDQKLLSEIYLMLQTRLKEAEVKDAIDQGDTRILDPGFVPDEPVAPQPMVNLVLATVLGLMLGITGAFGKALLDTKVRSRTDAEQAGGVMVLGTIPHMPMPRLAGGAVRRIALPGRKLVTAPEERLTRSLVTRSDPQDPVSEAYRALRTNLTFSNPDRVPGVLVVTSALRGDGKSTNAANLAVSLAQQGTRALLVDADLRRGVLHATLARRQEPGLAEVLLGSTTLEDALQEVEVGGAGGHLHFLSCGAFPDSPSELLASPRMRALVEELRGRFDRVVFDTPPMSVATDAALLGLAADATVLIARNGITDRASLEQAVRQLRHLRVPVSGVVLNDSSEQGRAGSLLGYAAAGR